MSRPVAALAAILAPVILVACASVPDPPPAPPRTVYLLPPVEWLQDYPVYGREDKSTDALIRAYARNLGSLRECNIDQASERAWREAGAARNRAAE